MLIFDFNNNHILADFLSNWQLIINPNAGNNKKFNYEQVFKLLKDKGFEFEAVFTEYSQHASELAQKAIEAGHRKFLILGGDGTYNEVVNGVFSQNTVSTSEILLGMLPRGTGNDWIKTMGLPKHLGKAIDLLAEGKTILQDVGRVSFGEGNETKESYFLNVAGMGFDAFVLQNFLMGSKKGPLSYVLGVIRGFLAYKNQLVAIESNGKIIETPLNLLAIGICRYYGNGMKICPKAIPDDGLFDITLGKDMNKWEWINQLKHMFTGRFKHKKIDEFRSNNLKITSPNPLYLQADGELFGHTPFEVSLIPQSLQVVIA